MRFKNGSIGVEYIVKQNKSLGFHHHRFNTCEAMPHFFANHLGSYTQQPAL
ncbi:hypothetical protein [Iodobacter fluviatilis]|uniref:hypothetical protein n=1 Tax=Iodobacter fluviatilis TaxID=537 RepID=UPI00140449C5|nr:hypothetical protein [Iodobacter fluviatilis]